LKSVAGRNAVAMVSADSDTNFAVIDDWNIYWANPWTVKQIFNPETGHRLGETQ